MGLKGVLLAAASGFTGAMVSDCSVKGSEFVMANASVVPDPPVQGSPALLLAEGVVNSVITGGAATLAVELSGFPLYQAGATTCGNTTITLPLQMGLINIAGLDCPTQAQQAQNVR